MKTSDITSRNWFGGLVITGLILAMGAAHAQIYVQDGSGIQEYNLDGTTVNSALYSGSAYASSIVASGNNLFITSTAGMVDQGTILEINATTGSVINSSVASGLNNPLGLAISGDKLFVANTQFDTGTFPNYVLPPGTIGEYTTSGATTNASLISGLNGPSGVAISGDNLFVMNSGGSSGTIGEYTTAGGTVNASLISGIFNPTAIAVSGNNLYVASNFANNSQYGTISEYNATTGAVMSSSLISVEYGIFGIAITGNNLFTTNLSTGVLGEYNATNGAAINASLVTGLDSPFAIAVSPESQDLPPFQAAPQTAPEPSTWAMLLGGLGLLAIWRRGNRLTLG